MHHSITMRPSVPASATEWSFMPSDSDWSRILSITARLVTGGASGNRIASIAAHNTDGDLLSCDIGVGSQAENATYAYNWRPGNANYGGDDGNHVAVSSAPGFWLPAGTVVKSVTAGLATNTKVQASGDIASSSLTLPVVVVAGTNDQFRWAGQGGDGTVEVFTVAAGSYATAGTLAAALQAATGTHSDTFAAQATVADDGSGGLLFTAVADQGIAGNADTWFSAATHDVVTTITGSTLGPGDFALDGGTGGNDQWDEIVATFVVADARHWQTIEALIAAVNPGG